MPNPFKKTNLQDTHRMLFDLFHDRVYRVAYYITKDRYLAQDVLQETFVKAIRKLEFVESEEKMGAWLTKIATNTAIDVLRAKKRWNEMPTEDVILEKHSMPADRASSLEKQVIQQETREQVHDQIDRLNERDKQIIVLKYMNELKDQEIAELLDLELGTVKSRLHRAKKKLRLILSESGDLTDGDIS